MAKGKDRPAKQEKKAKSVEKKPSGPKYLRDGDALQGKGLGEHKGGKKPGGK